MTSRTPCCPQCYGTEYAKAYPLHATAYSCSNPSCQCHAAPVEEWEKQFDAKFGVHHEGQITNENLPSIKDFIRSHGEREYERGKEDARIWCGCGDEITKADEQKCSSCQIVEKLAARHAVLEEIIEFIDERKAKGHENDTILSALTAELKVGKFFRTDSKDV